jgi:CheY-like chemotaxis protein
MSLRVLIVEDESDAAEIIEALLAHYQVETVLVASAEAACEALDAEPYDALIVDLFLPQMDGIELMKTLRQQATTAELPCIAVTAYNSSSLRRRALEAGYNRYFAKPVNPDDLIDALKSILA